MELRRSAQRAVNGAKGKGSRAFWRVSAKVEQLPVVTGSVIFSRPAT
jgi:hypothetical protein